MITRMKNNKYDKKTKERYLPVIKDFSYHKGKAVSHQPPPFEHLCKIIYLNAGCATFTVNGLAYEADAGTMLICNAGCTSSEAYQASSERYVIYMDNIFLGGLEENCIVHDDHSPVIRTGIHTVEFIALLNFIREEWQYKNVRYEQNCHSVLLAIYGLIDRCYQMGNEVIPVRRALSKKHPLIQPVQDYIHQHFNEALTLQEIAEHFYLNQSYLSHLIKRELGVSFTRYVTNLRLHEAQKLLLATEYSIAEIANQIGYEDYRYFLHLFKKQFHVTPKTYRKHRGIIRQEKVEIL